MFALRKLVCSHGNETTWGSFGVVFLKEDTTQSSVITGKKLLPAYLLASEVERVSIPCKFENKLVAQAHKRRLLGTLLTEMKNAKLLLYVGREME